MAAYCEDNGEHLQSSKAVCLFEIQLSEFVKINLFLLTLLHEGLCKHGSKSSGFTIISRWK